MTGLDLLVVYFPKILRLFPAKTDNIHDGSSNIYCDEIMTPLKHCPALLQFKVVGNTVNLFLVRNNAEKSSCVCIFVNVLLHVYKE